MISDVAFQRLVERLDILEVTNDGLERKVKELTGKVQELSQTEAKRRGQPDWRTVSDPLIAETFLLSVDEWLTKSAVYLGLQVPDCWPWHPNAVVLLLDISQHDRAVYAGSAPAAVTDFLGTRLPAIQSRISIGCLGSGHVEPDGSKYRVQRDELPALASWWATDRTGRAPGLYAIDDIRRAA